MIGYGAGFPAVLAYDEFFNGAAPRSIGVAGRSCSISSS